MLNHMFTQLIRSIGIFFRTFRAYFRRQVVGIWTAIRRMTNFSRLATKAATDSLQGVVSVSQKPTKREDYLETRRLFISKYLILKILLFLIALILIFYFVLWPFLLSHFLVARFYVEDKRIENWSGRVIVFSDKEKKLPLYSGRLEAGVLQGQGKLYDANGLLYYEGQVSDGIPSGSGTEYRHGILQYEGHFAEGLYEGSGRLYDKGGWVSYEGQFVRGKFDGMGKEFGTADVLSYEGQFAQGVRDGTGREYDENGKLCYDGQLSGGLYDGLGKAYGNGKLLYEGSFSEGLYDGEGSSYYPSGILSYKGQFSAGLPDGIGASYEEGGRLLYEGGFSKGKYQGDGKYYPGQGQELDALFQDGEPDGVVSWKKNGQLYYEGEWAGGGPQGFGKLYSKSGQVVYEGEFSEGSLAGEWILGLGAQELRDMLGEERIVTENDSRGGYWLRDAELGLSALCSFRTEDSDSMVNTVYLAKPRGESWIELLPGMDRVSFGTGDGEEVLHGVQFSPPEGILLPDGQYDLKSIGFEDGEVRVFFREGEKQAQLVVWTKPGTVLQGFAAVAGSESGADSAAEQRMSSFLAGLGIIPPQGEGAGVVGAGAPYMGSGEVGEAIAGSSSPQKAADLVNAMLDYWEQSERQASLERNLERTNQLLEDAERALAQGNGSQAEVDALKAQKLLLEDAVQSCIVGRSRAQLDAQGAGGPDPSQYSLASLPICFDPSGINADELAARAENYAGLMALKDGQDDGAAPAPDGAQDAGREASEDGEAYDIELRKILLDMGESYSRIKSLVSAYEAEERRSGEEAANYASGGGSRQSWYQALSSQSDSRSALYSQVAVFTRQINRLNLLTGGWVSENQNWFGSEFGELFQREAESLEAERAAREEAAARETAMAVQEAENETVAFEKSGDQDPSRPAWEEIEGPARDIMRKNAAVQPE